MKTYQIKEIIEYIVALVNEFATKYNLTEPQAARYIDFHGGFSFIKSNYGIIHTLAFDEAVESLSLYCRRMGGKL